MCLYDGDHNLQGNQICTTVKIISKMVNKAYIKETKYPISADGYAEAVNASDQQEILSRLDQFGLVVVPVLSSDECSQTLASFFKESNEQQRPGATRKLSMDPLTWGNENWPNKSHFLVRRRPSIGLEPTRVRTHPTIHKVFATIFGTERLQTSIDRWGVMRGTVNIPTQVTEDGKIPCLQDHPEWRQHLRLHWDMNPWAYVMDKRNMNGQCQHRYQALVAILDSPENVGGFRGVPGSHHWYLEQFAGTHSMPPDYSMTAYRSVKIPEDDPAQNLSQTIPIRAGHMIVFDSRLLHGTVPNASSAMRLVQYVRMMPTDMAQGDVFSAEQVLQRHPDWKKQLESYQLDERAKRLLCISFTTY